jgi:hypothetical protein
MIRAVHSSHRSSRMGQSITMTPGCISYLDPTSGLYLADPGTSCGGAGDGSGPDSPLPADPGAVQTLADYTAAQAGSANSDVLNAQQQVPSLVLAESLMSGNIPSPLPGLGLTVPLPTVTVPSWIKWALLAGAAVVVVGATRR